jgi:ComF family protein
MRSLAGLRFTVNRPGAPVFRGGEILSFWQSVWGDLRRCCDLFLPPACLLCGSRLADGSAAIAFCAACQSGLQQPGSARCPVCAVAYHALLPSRHHCEACLRHPPAFVRVHAVGPYAGTLRQAVQRFKYQGQLPLARPLGELLVISLRNGAAPRPDLVVPVPLHVSRLRARGYNQSLELARHVGRRLRAPVAVDLLQRVRATAPQQELDAAARKSNLLGAFAVSRRLPGRRILLVDDVLTTGATARGCAAALRAAGAAAVEVAVLGRA